MGIMGMRRRVEEFGGDFSMQSTPGRGTTVAARIPFTQMEHPGA
jgi:signal transduction histidine kinase